MPYANAEATFHFVLVVEDEPSLLESLEEILRLAGYHPVPAATAHEALHILNTASIIPRLIISDILMPGMDGYQFYAAVRSQSPQHIPFLFISGQEATRLIVDPLCGVVGYLSKPFRISDLLEMIDHALAR